MIGFVLEVVLEAVLEAVLEDIARVTEPPARRHFAIPTSWTTGECCDMERWTFSADSLLDFLSLFGTQLCEAQQLKALEAPQQLHGAVDERSKSVRRSRGIPCHPSP